MFCEGLSSSRLWAETGNALSSQESHKVTWNMSEKYGITAPGIARAIKDAKSYFIRHPNDQLILEFNKGSYYLEQTDDAKGTIDLSGLKPGLESRLIFQGQGSGKTTFVFDNKRCAIYGRNVFRVSFLGIHMTRKDSKVSQGHVVEVAPGKVVINIQKGFPTPMEIFNPLRRNGRWLRRYSDSKDDPQVIQEKNKQIAWNKTTLVSERTWQLDLNKSSELANYSKGDLIGIKSKHGGGAYWFFGGSDMLFEDIKWTRETRGKFRGGFNKIHIKNCVTDRSPPVDGQVPCLASIIFARHQHLFCCGCGCFVKMIDVFRYSALPSPG